MKQIETLCGLLQAVQRGNGYTVHVQSIQNVHGVVYIGLLNPRRKAKMTEATYDKIKDYLIL